MRERERNERMRAELQTESERREQERNERRTAKPKRENKSEMREGE